MRSGGRARPAALLVAVAALLGAAAVPALDAYLAVSFADKEPLVGVARVAEGPVVADLGTDAVRLDVPPVGDPLLDLAVQQLTASLEGAGAVVSTGPATGSDPTSDPGGDAPTGGPADVLVARTGEPVATGRALPAAEDAYALARDGGTVRLGAATREGLAAGLFQLSDRVDSGESWRDVRPGPVDVAPVLDRRFVDTGAVGMRPDPDAYAAQDDYVHATGALADVVLAEQPWLDAAALAEVDEQWRAYVDRMVAYGYDGVVVPGFLEYVTFDGVGDGEQVYPAGSPYRGRARAMQEQVGAMWAYADTMGMDVVVVTDMVALTTPLQAYLERQPGGLDTSSPQLWEVYREGADELLTALPFVDGIMLRVGEAGAVYNLDGWDYYSELEVTEADQVGLMVRAFSAAAAAHDADVYLRSWSVGVGGVGDLHTSPETYEQVLGDLGPGQGLDNLVVSTKFVAGDFDSWLPLNPTLLEGPQQRLVEVQARREFEASGAVPDDTTADHAAALRRLREANPLVDGVWVWTQSGGPQRAGPMSLYLRTGFWQQWDLQVWTSARLAWDPDADLEEMERTWLRRTFSEDPGTVAALSRLQALSRQAVLDGFYVGPYAEQEVRAFGLEPPPMMWVFKWDLVGGDTATWSAVYGASRGRVDEAVEGGERAVETVEQMQALVRSTDPAGYRDPVLRERLEASLAWEHDLFVTLGAYREAMLRGHEWLDTGDPAAREAHLAAADRYRVLAREHRARWEGDLDLPPYELAAATTGLERLDAQPAATWTARGLLLLAALALAASPLLRRAVLLPWRLDGCTVASARRGDRAAAVVVLAVVAVGDHAALGAGGTGPLPLAGAYVAVAVLTGVAAVLGGTVAGTVSDRRAGRPARALLWVAVLAGPQLVGVLPLLGATALRGPVGAWAGFWLDPVARGAYVVAATVALACVLLAPVLTGAAASRAARAAVALAAAGSALVGLGGTALALGQERLLTTVNDGLQVVPGGLSRILGITVHLGVPEVLPTAGLLAGGAAWTAALLLLVAGRRPWRPPGPAPAQPPSTLSASAIQSAST
ncbi:hypothetical protein ACFQL5_02235 [Aquipuribacter hungaricus]|uniref:hypothetical protein n=1 Tax=Aquipuribacter hungaricus TaxID=545624 RepID=UPI00361B567D